MDAPRPGLQNPIEGTTFDTDPSTLHLQEGNEGPSSKVVDRLLRKTSQAKRSTHRKLHSLSRKSRTSQDNQEKLKGIEKDAFSQDNEVQFLESDLNSSSRPSLTSLTFRGEGSLRMGTQALIQALHAVPWQENDDGIQDKDDSDENDADKPAFALSSSIHTIHRPVARIRRRSTAVATASSEGSSIEEEEEGDFDPQVSTIAPGSEGPASTGTGTPPDRTPATNGMMRRSTSLATIKVQKRARLAEKLKEVFEVNEVEEVIAGTSSLKLVGCVLIDAPIHLEMPCWLLRSVLLQGYMYLTNSHICFFAHMPSRENQVLKSGSLAKKAQRTMRWNKHWFVLKNDALTWFHSSADPYFPHGVVDLKYAISVEAHGEKGFRIRTHQKTVNLEADSIPSRDEWVKAIGKVIFQAQNLGDNVKIAIPYGTVLDVEKSSAMDFSETIEIKVVDKEDNCVDSYFFAYFHNITHAVDQIRKAVQMAKGRPELVCLETVKDTTSYRASLQPPRPPSSDAEKTPIVSSSSPPSSSALSTMREKLSTPAQKLGLKRRSIDAHPASLAASESAPVIADLPNTMSTSHLSGNHTYPPSLVHHPFSQGSETSARSSWSVPVGVPSWLKSTSRYFFSSSPDSPSVPLPGIVESEPPSRRSISEQTDFGFAIVDGLDSSALDPTTVEKFRAAFAFDEREVLLAEIPGYLFRVLPVFGRVNISSNYFCFRSAHKLTKTRMMIPIRDILATENAKAFRFGHHGLAVVIKGHEELFFEFNSIERRSACAQLLEKLIEEHRERERQRHGTTTPASPEKNDPLILETLESRMIQEGENEDPKPPPESRSDSLPAVMFTSVGSTFLTFKPQESLRFTCLTIGSRGDVQPYVALAKGLQADGHKVKIATHLEFKGWIEGHGIEYAYVGGDPAELMRICVENGTFTVSFLREGLSKFRGWLDDLLKTSWEACQGTDVLIESPSAMGGIHIAEALQIPYYRAFTMPWTRTRAYPHAFAVPETKMGGSYNYLTYVMFDQVFWRAISGQINRWRRQTLNIPATTMDKQEAHKVPFLYNFSPTIVPPPLDWYEWIRVTGYWFLDDSEGNKWEAPADLVAFIKKARTEGKKLVYIGFGSIVVSDPEAMTKCVIEAVKASGVYAIMSKGWSDRLSSKKNDIQAAEAVPPLPSQIYNVTSVPHDWLFQQIDAACHHGGAGTTGASLRAGIPTIIRPFFGDQFFWADRVETLGIGSSVRKLTVENLTAALINATTDRKQIDRARAVGAAIRSENGVAKAIESIYRDLEYARSIIKVSTERHEPEDTDNEWEAAAKSGESAKGALSEDWSLVEEHGEVLKDSSGGLSALKRLSGFTASLHTSRAKSTERSQQ